MISLTGFFAVFALALLVACVRRRSSRLPLPPGPSGYPVVGHVLDKAGFSDYKMFPTHRAKWGDITSVTVLGRTTVTVHTYEKALELLHTKGLIYSSRPEFPMFFLGGWKDNVPFVPYNSQLRQCRKMIRSELNYVKIGDFHEHQNAWIQRLIDVLKKRPDQFCERVQWYTSAVTLKIVYGYDMIQDDDPMVKLMHEGTSNLHDESSGPGQILEFIPWLRYVPAWFPFVEFKRIAMQWRVSIADMRDIPFDYAVSNNDGVRKDNFVVKQLERAQIPEQLWYLRHSAMVFFLAGVDTTSSVLLTFFFRMQAHPDIQREAQKEIDAVVGKNILPRYSDRDRLPYINALCKELLRYNPPVPSGVPHKSTADDIHDGYFIPKGTVVVSSIWEMSRDPSVYKDPDTFDPTRFLGPNPERDPGLYAFGFGRRICLGRLLAEDIIFLTVSAVLATFDLSPFDEKHPAVFQLPTGFLSAPLPFKCNITPRAGVSVE